MRYGELDFLRGLCLIDMVIVHLIIFIPEFWFESLVEMTNLAAEGFFLVAGIMVGLIVYPRFVKDSWKVTLASFRRAFWIGLVHVFTIAVFGVIYHFMGLLRISSFSDLIGVLVRVASFEKVYHLTNILWLFVLFFLLAPVVMWLYKKYGWKVVLGLSLGLLVMSFFFPVSLFISYPSFPILSWQFVFVVGMLIGIVYPDLREKKLPMWSLGVMGGVFALLFIVRFQLFLGFEWHFLWFETFFKKFPLNPGLLMYVGLLLVFVFRMVHRFYDRIPSVFRGFVEMLGKYSLVGFIVHMYADFVLHKLDETYSFVWWVKWVLFFFEIGMIYLVVVVYGKVLVRMKKGRKVSVKG